MGNAFCKRQSTDAAGVTMNAPLWNNATPTSGSILTMATFAQIQESFRLVPKRLRYFKLKIKKLCILIER